MKKLSIGYDSFERIQKLNGYYVDKTGFIKEFLESPSQVTLFTRPRRFGKTLLLTTLKTFFSIGSDPSLFNDLSISREIALCNEYQGKYPVVFITLKNVCGKTFNDAVDCFANCVANIFDEFSFLLNSDRVSSHQKFVLNSVLSGSISRGMLIDALNMLVRALAFYYGRNVIVLIDEYDAPLNEAYYNGYIEEMTDFIRSFLGNVLKTNEYLEFAVLTGCFRISKESIFSGLNNFKCDTVSDFAFAKYFGFVDGEVAEVLEHYGLMEYFGRVKEWYDGYRFGNEEIYCPWDVLNYVSSLLVNPKVEPQLFWINTSSNKIVRELIDYAGTSAKADLEKLIDGESVRHELCLEMVYSSLKDPNLLWSALYLSGYLTLDHCSSGVFRGEVAYRVPNKEVREILVRMVEEWYREKVVPLNCSMAMEYLFGKNSFDLQKLLNHVLVTTISFHDYKEDYYHALLVGLFVGDGQCIVESNKENGLGRSDIVVKNLRSNTAVIIEVKRVRSVKDLESSCILALDQIEKEQYAAPLLADGFEVLKYGISFYKKRCCVKLSGSTI